MTDAEFGDVDIGYIDRKRRSDLEDLGTTGLEIASGSISKEQEVEVEGRMVDIVLSDMSAPWEQTTGFWKRSLSDPYYRLMNASGMSFRDHAGSMVRVHSPKEWIYCAHSDF